MIRNDQVSKRLTVQFFPAINLRQRTMFVILIAVFILMGVLIGASLLDNERLATHLDARNAVPSLTHPFGTDWLGRDMFARTLKGLSLSIGVGMLAAICSVMIALFLGLSAATLGKTADRIVSWLIDIFLSVPHMVSLILIAFAMGGGIKGVIAGVALTHWPSLARVIRAEVMQLRNAEFVQLSRQLGKSAWWVSIKHILPHLVPQLLVGLLLTFPHAILHEAAVSFIGLGLSPHTPAIGIILSESMGYLSSGMWWLAFFPGISLLIIVRTFDVIGENLRLMIEPHRSQY